MPATNLNDIYANFNNKPISVEKLDEFYVDPIEGRGDNPIRTITRRLQNEPMGSMKMIFAGYRGCGKSTELNMLQKHLEGDFVVLNYSIQKELDPITVNYIELFIVTMEKLFDLVKKENLNISDTYLEIVSNWIQTKEISEINDKYIGAEIGVNAEAGFSIPFLTKFFAGFKAAAKASSSMKEVLKRQVEPKLSELISNCNLLINEIKLSLHKIDKKGLIIIIEDLDKLSLGKAEELFYNHSSQLVTLNTHTIFTFPISLIYHPKFTFIRNVFDEDFELPMIKVNSRDGKPYTNGRKVMKDIVAKRMDLGLFGDIAILDKMIAISGGCLRDLFRLIIDASDRALDYNRTKIKKEDFDRAYYALRRDYSNTISEKKEGNKVVIAIEEYYEALVKAAQDPTKEPDNTSAVLDLRQNLCILGYNDTRWCDVHPMVREILKDKGKLDG